MSTQRRRTPDWPWSARLIRGAAVPRGHRVPVWLACLVAFALALAPGCRPREAAAPRDGASPSTAATLRPLRIVTLDDSGLGQAIAREWQANSTEPVELENMASDAVTSDPLNADVVIFPTSRLGQLVTARQIVPWPAGATKDRGIADEAAGQDDYDWNDVLPWLRRRELRWGKDLYGVSFGSPQLLLVYRSDLLSQWGLTPPSTWQEYGQLVATIQQRIRESPGGVPRYASVEPTGEGWAARMLLARAATYASHPNQYSTLFQFTTMTPWIDRPPFVRALEELVRDLEALPAEARALSPDEVMASLLTGETAIGITWPSPARAQTVDVPPQAAFTIAPLPGATEVYEMASQAWQQRPDNSPQTVPLLGVAGRMGAVARRARSPLAAQSFLLWLTGSEASSRISVGSTATTLFRSSHTARPQAWVEGALAPAAGQFAEAMLFNQRQPNAFMILRIPGQERYLQSLDQAVRDAIAGQIDAATALRQVAETWTQLTQTIGYDAQRDAYAASLGLDF